MKKSKELSSFLGVSQAQIFQKQQSHKEENQSYMNRRKVSIDINSRNSPFQHQTKKGERLYNQQQEALLQQQNSFRVEDRSNSKEDAVRSNITNSNSIKALINYQIQQDPKSSSNVPGIQMSNTNIQAQHDQNCRRNHLNQSRKNFYKTTFVGQKVQASAENSQNRDEMTQQQNSNFNIPVS